MTAATSNASGDEWCCKQASGRQYWLFIVVGGCCGWWGGDLTGFSGLVLGVFPRRRCGCLSGSSFVGGCVRRCSGCTQWVGQTGLLAVCVVEWWFGVSCGGPCKA